MLRFYAIFDKKGQLFSTPQVSRSDADAIRSVQAGMEEPKSNLGRYPEDYSLFFVFGFDEVNGKVVQSSSEPILVVNLFSLVKGSSNAS